ncbi:MAG: orotidine-5'-phosphate decarboxylase [Pseudomonadota bacterium]
MKHLPFSQRAELAENTTAKKLFQMIAEKKSNLALSADLTTSSELFKLIEQVGEHIAVLKTHIDILTDFSPAVIERLIQYTKQYQVLIFEDRKFADIGNTVSHQYQHGIYTISNWADIINAHILPGEGIIDGLKKIGQPLQRGLLLIAQMSSSNNFFSDDYVQANIELAKKHADFVIGFICQQQLMADPTYIHMTPGVKLEPGKDALGQAYLTPEYVIGEQYSDMIIVGRGIIHDKQPAKMAQQYRERAWQAYQQTL